jgi:hypothetical protein
MMVLLPAATTATIVATIPHLAANARDALDFQFTVRPGSPAEVLRILFNNAKVSLLIALLSGTGGSHAGPCMRACAVGLAAINALPVAVAVGAYGSEIVPWSRHLPFELAAIIVALGNHPSKATSTSRAVLRRLAPSTLLLAVAAVLESYASG